MSMSNQCFFFPTILEQRKVRKDLLAANVKIFISLWGGEKGWWHLSLSISSCVVDVYRWGWSVFHFLCLSFLTFTLEYRIELWVFRFSLYRLVDPCQCLINVFSFVLSMNYINRGRICLQLMSISLSLFERERKGDWWHLSLPFFSWLCQIKEGSAPS